MKDILKISNDFFKLRMFISKISEDIFFEDERKSIEVNIAQHSIEVSNDNWKMIIDEKFFIQFKGTNQYFYEQDFIKLIKFHSEIIKFKLED